MSQTIVDQVLSAIGKSGETPEMDCFCGGDGMGYCDGKITGPCVACCPVAYAIFNGRSA